MDWTVENNMVNGLFYATLTSHRRDHTPFVHKITHKQYCV